MFILKRKIIFILLVFAIICFGAEWDYTGTAYCINNEDNNPQGIFKDGDYWYMVGNGNDSVYKYDSDWNYTGIAYYVYNEERRPRGIFKDGVFWYLVGNREDRVFKYDSNWSYTGISFYVGNEDRNPRGIFRYGKYWYLVGMRNDNVYKYDSNWVYTGISYDIGDEESDPQDIFRDGDYWYLVGSQNDNVYKYDSSWSYTGISFNVRSEDRTPTGIFNDGYYWYIVGSSNDSVYKYEGPPVQYPNIPSLIQMFDNAIFNAYPPPYVCTLSVVSTDFQDDSIQYEIEWDTDYNFSNPFSNTTGIFPSGYTVILPVLLGTSPEEAETLFYWKARARDPSGSGIWSEWSEIRSFTMDMDLGNSYSYWFQVAGMQFETCDKDSVIVQGDSVILKAGENNGILTSTPIVFNDLTIESPDRSHWDGVKWTKSSADDSIGVQIEYMSGGIWSLIPNSDLPGNSNGLFDNTSDFCIVDLSSLNTLIYDSLRIKAIFIRGSGKASSNPVLKMWGLGNTEDNITGVHEDEESNKFSMIRINPNPFINNTEIQYRLSNKTNVTIQVFDIMGRTVTILLNSEKEPGDYIITWRGTNNNGNLLPSGVYFLQMKAEDFITTCKIHLIR